MTRIRHKIKKSAMAGVKVALCLIILDLAILLAGLMQIASGDGSGHWNAFWRIQLEVLMWLFR
jgi:hypothetical protein